VATRHKEGVTEFEQFSPIPAWKYTIMPFEIMFHRTPRILARPSLPKYQGMTKHLQEMARGQTRAQDICRELCERTPCGTNPGSGLQTPETLKVGNLVLIRREIVATNKINSVLKLTGFIQVRLIKSSKFLGTTCQCKSMGQPCVPSKDAAKGFSTRLERGEKPWQIRKPPSPPPPPSLKKL
jgi:hypothetical protein